MAYLGKSPTEIFRSFSVKDTFTGDGSTLVFTLSRAAFVGSPNDVQVFVDNVRQEPGSGKAYTIELDGSSNATKLTFTAAPPAASEIYVIISAEPTTVVVPADNSVSTAKVQDGAITSAKIADGTVIAADVNDGTITGAKLASDIAISTTGTVTATSFSGDGSSLTALNISTDSTPQLGGNLDLNSNDITGTGNINITGTGTFSGDLTVDTNTLYVDSSNNRVGIRTTNPTASLHISSSASNQILIERSGANTLELAASTISVGNYVAFSNNLSFLNDSYSERMRIDSSGNVGIGTSSPDNLLHIEGDQPTYKLTSTNPLSTAAGTETIADIDFEAQNNNLYRTTAKIRARQDGTWSTVTSNLAPTALDFFTQDNSTSDAMTSPRMTISSSGNVGIGTNSPGTILHVISDTDADGMIVNCVGTPTNFHFDVRNDNASIFRVDENGNVGIGLTNPTEELDVAGNMSGNNVLPRADNLYDLGSSSKRYNDLYLGGGLYVGGTGSANYLDDYEEGTWTPQYDNNSNNLAVTYDIQLGTYRKIGSVVFISGTLRTNSVTRSGVWIKLDNLPFAITTSATDSEIGGLNIHEATAFDTDHPSTGVCKVSVAGFILSYRSSANGNTILLQDADMATGTTSNKLAFSGFYFTDA